MRPGDEILTSDHDHDVLDKTWGHVARRSGARIVVAEVPMSMDSEAGFSAAIATAMNERTWALFRSHITSTTALCLPMGASEAEAWARGIWSVIDGAHTPGHITLGFERRGA